jgi:hypothetical protein
MDEATLVGETEFWLCETHGWPCACLNTGGCAEAFQCDACLIHDNVRIAAEAVREGRWQAGYRAVKRAADRDGRLDKLRDALEIFAFAPYEEMEVGMAQGSGPVVATDEPRFICGLTIAEHKEICADVVRRECELEKVGQLHEEELGIHLQLANHPACGSTISWPLAGHVAEPVE